MLTIFVNPQINIAPCYAYDLSTSTNYLSKLKDYNLVKGSDAQNK